MDIAYVLLGILAGFTAGFFIRKLSFEKESIPISNFNELKSMYEKVGAQNEYAHQEAERLQKLADSYADELKELTKQNAELSESLAENRAHTENLKKKSDELQKYNTTLNEKLEQSGVQTVILKNEIAELKAKLNAEIQQNKKAEATLSDLKKSLQETETELKETSAKRLQAEEQNKNLIEKLDLQKEEIQKIGESFTNRFKVLADEILEEKSQKFTKQNKSNLENILAPLGKNIADFKKKVEETYDKESKQRFSLEEKIKELADLNKKINVEAQNLTKALKGDSKKQGNWGEMILENILENSGLQKDREYFVQEFLRTEDGKTITDDSGRKLQPDVIIKYPDKRKIIIDSKVSLNAYEEYVSSEDEAEKEAAMKRHLASVKKHIDGLSAKNYHKAEENTLDFVMMFVPVEPAYMDAVRSDPALWDYAYKKRILLISPTNLIAALKLVHDLWQREYQNRNAIEIAERGGKLYDKFVNFVESMSDIGSNLAKTQKSYTAAFKQLSDGRGNLVGQVQKLKKLGINAQKTMPAELAQNSESEDEE